MAEIYGIRWILVNNWNGEGFRTRTFGANLPTGVLFRTVDRFDQADVNKPNFGAIEIVTALEFVPSIRILADDAPSGEWPAIEEKTGCARRPPIRGLENRRKMEMVLDPRFLRGNPEPIGTPIDLSKTPEEARIKPREPRIHLDDQAEEDLIEVTELGDTEPTFVPTKPRIQLDDDQAEAQTELAHRNFLVGRPNRIEIDGQAVERDAASGHFLDPPPAPTFRQRIANLANWISNFHGRIRPSDLRR